MLGLKGARGSLASIERILRQENDIDVSGSNINTSSHSIGVILSTAKLAMRGKLDQSISKGKLLAAIRRLEGHAAIYCEVTHPTHVGGRGRGACVCVRARTGAGGGAGT